MATSPRCADQGRVGAPHRIDDLRLGSEDRFQDPDDGRCSAAAMPNGRVTEVPGGHHPWWDDAEGCAVLIEEAVSHRAGTHHPGITGSLSPGRVRSSSVRVDTVWDMPCR